VRELNNLREPKLTGSSVAHGWTARICPRNVSSTLAVIDYPDAISALFLFAETDNFSAAAICESWMS